MNVTCFIDSLAAGGAERALLHLAEGLAGRGHNLRIVTINAAIPDFYPVPPGIGRAVIPVTNIIRRWYDLKGHAARLRLIRSCAAEQPPDVIISFVDMTNILILAAFRSGRPPVIVCEQVNPLQYHIVPHWRLLRRLLYPYAARVVMLTEDTYNWARSLRPAWKAARIANPVPSPVFSTAPARPDFFKRPMNLVAVGRLNPQKGFDMLLRAFSRITAGFPGWQLTILGEGPERGRLEKLAAEVGLGGSLAMPGVSTKPFDVLKHSDLFVMSSRYEGFPLALAEALACGVPAVSFDCPSGPGEMIRHGTDGLLVPAGDEAGLAGALAELMTDDGRRKKMAERAPDILRRFSLEKYLDSWEGLLKECVK